MVIRYMPLPVMSPYIRKLSVTLLYIMKSSVQPEVAERRQIKQHKGDSLKIRPLQGVRQDKAADEDRADVIADHEETVPFFPVHLPLRHHLGGDAAAEWEAEEKTGEQRIDSGSRYRKNPGKWLMYGVCCVA